MTWNFISCLSVCLSLSYMTWNFISFLSVCLSLSPSCTQTHSPTMSVSKLNNQARTLEYKRITWGHAWQCSFAYTSVTVGGGGGNPSLPVKDTNMTPYLPPENHWIDAPARACVRARARIIKFFIPWFVACQMLEWHGTCVARGRRTGRLHSLLCSLWTRV